LYPKKLRHNRFPTLNSVLVHSVSEGLLCIFCVTSDTSSIL